MAKEPWRPAAAAPDLKERRACRWELGYLVGTTTAERIFGLVPQGTQELSNLQMSKWRMRMRSVLRDGRPGDHVG